MLLLGAVLLFSGCYHAQITTDKAPSSTVIEQKWAMSFVFGLVPPPIVETAQQCPNGLSRVETRISFLNGLVAGLSGSIITPMEIRVTCAAGGMAGREDRDLVLTVPDGATPGEVQAAMQEAAQRSLEQGAPVGIQFQQ